MLPPVAGNIAGNLATQLIGGLVGGSAPPAIATASNKITVAPIAVNLGEILRPYNEGSVTNGGYGMPVASRFITNLSGNETFTVSGGGELNLSSPLVLAVIGGIVAMVVFMRKK